MLALMLAALSNAVVATLLALLAVVGGRLCRRRPAVAHGLWLLVLLKLVTPPLLPIRVWSTPSPPAPLVSAPAAAPLVAPAGPEEIPAPQAEAVDLPPAHEAGPVEAVDPLAAGASAPTAPVESGTPGEPEPGSASDPSSVLLWWRGLLGLWALGSLGWFALAGWRLNAFRRLLRYAVPAPEAVRSRVAELAGRLGLTRCPEVRLLPGRLAPLLWAAGARPLLLLPQRLLGRLDGHQLDALLTHELAHLRRRDHWVRWLELVVLGLYWWFPVAWLARGRLRAAEEECCDAWVVATLPGAARAYATALLETVDFVSEVPAALPLLASGLGEVRDLKRRLTMILRGTTPRSLGWRGALAVFALGVLGLSLAPVWGRADQEDDRRPTPTPVDPTVQLDPRVQPETPTPGVRPGLGGPGLPQVPGQHVFGDDIEKLRQQVNLQRAIVEKQRAELAVAEAHLAAANANLRARMAGLEKAVRERPPTVPGMPPPTTVRPPVQGEQRIEELEKRLDQVLKELQELRRDLKPRGNPGQRWWGGWQGRGWRPAGWARWNAPGGWRCRRCPARITCPGQHLQHLRCPGRPLSPPLRLSRRARFPGPDRKPEHDRGPGTLSSARSRSGGVKWRRSPSSGR